jgi:ATP-binding cassette subfamily B protein
VAALLLNLYDADSGMITLNGTEIRDIDKKFLRTLIASVPQHSILFDGTILDNIAVGDETPDLERAVEYCEMLGLMPLINELPCGIHTRLNEQGMNLSGGQKQKICIARALYRQSPVLVLDEATSSLDAESENKIMQTIEWYRNKGNTVIIIAHNDTTLKICDNIAILENGRINY